MESKLLIQDKSSSLGEDRVINLSASILDNNNHQQQQFYQQHHQQQPQSSPSPSNPSSNNAKNKKLFPKKLWDLINDDKYNFCLRWSDDGQLVYLNRDEFEDSYLKTPENQFHTQKAISFVRQMNMYGFRKVDDCYYENDNFKRGCEHLLKNMIRKHPNKLSTNVSSASMNGAAADLTNSQNLPYTYRTNPSSLLQQSTTGISLLASKHGNSDETTMHVTKKMKHSNNANLANQFNGDQNLPIMYRTNSSSLLQSATGTSLLASAINNTVETSIDLNKKLKNSSNQSTNCTNNNNDTSTLPFVYRTDPSSLMQQQTTGTSLLASMNDTNETSIDLNKKSKYCNNISLNNGINIDQNLPSIYRTDPSSLLQTSNGANPMLPSMNNINETNIHSALYANFAFYLLVTKWIEETIQVMARR